MLFRNLIYALRHQKLSSTLNILGFSCALAIFAICLIQIVYEMTFNRCYTNGDYIYSVRMYSDNTESFCDRLCQPLLRALSDGSPHIKSMTIAMNGQVQLSTTEKGEKANYDVICFNKEAGPMFNYKMIQGSFASIENDKRSAILIPESMAHKLFGNNVAVGRALYATNGFFVVGGVYKDFPQNSAFKNSIVTNMQRNDDWSEYSYYAYYWTNTNDEKVLMHDMYLAAKKNNIMKQEENEQVFKKNIKLVRFSDSHFMKEVTGLSESSSTSYLYSLIAIAIVVLLIAIINYMNFQMALVPMRIRSINTQKVFGASTSSLRLSLMMEGVGVAVLSFAISLAWLYLLDLTPVHEWISAGFLPENNLGTMVIMLGIAVATGIISAIYPSIYITSFQPALVLKGSFGRSSKGRKLRAALVGFQYMASFALIMVALLMYVQIRFMVYSPKGYDADRLIVYDMGSESQLRPFLPTLEQKLCDHAFIESCATAEVVMSTRDAYMGWGRKLHGKNFSCETLVVNSTNYLKTLGIKVTGGRDFNEDDAAKQEGALIFNEMARRQYNLLVGDVIEPGAIVGFMNNVNYATMNKEIKPMCLWLNCQKFWGREPNVGYVRVSKNANLHEARKAVEKDIRSLCPNYNGKIGFVDEALEESYKQEEKMLNLILICSLIAVLISLAGVFGMICFENRYRRHEIGIRKVLGDSTMSILVRLNRHYLWVMLAGFVVAIPCAIYVFSLWGASYAYRTPLPLWVFIVALLLMALITFSVITIQSWKTANENPVNSIRAE